MAVMSRQVNIAFELAPEKKEQFLKVGNGEKSSDKAIARACRYAPKSTICANRTEKK